MDQPLYREVQHFFRQWIFLLPVAAVTIIVWYEFLQQVVLGQPQGDQPIPDWLAWVLTIVFGLGFPAAGLLIRLVTEVRPGELAVRLYPFRPAVIPIEMIGEAAVRQYSPIKEYGGWGVRINRHNGRAYSAYGASGVQLVLADGMRLLIGTQRPQELLAALESAGLGSSTATTRPKRKRSVAREDA